MSTRLVPYIFFNGRCAKALEFDKSAFSGSYEMLRVADTPMANGAWSAMTSVPGVLVAPGQNGYIGVAPTLRIRLGDFNQICYELDRIPVNQAFDDYSSNALSSLGQHELQVYADIPARPAMDAGFRQ